MKKAKIFFLAIRLIFQSLEIENQICKVEDLDPAHPFVDEIMISKQEIVDKSDGVYSYRRTFNQTILIRTTTSAE